ncbi:RecQ family ATP-dependent DNA helicase [Conexibacter woesei]|uniref:ATP-dependent DNA helicase RecQ n=1 Tax=Conexibacter woesei (strain DSM 14684 / CCUG 47730 / CIP 108061 / JCM 11494 / NBRC 100937 / ID131577) TaxID=469383 RepID=D3FAI9_CONWI|nr:ATP-dependent DNA helicase RecQ [Conexibacter woesei]ADB49258.1 ATP-dependent DNA helicase, RecQ family [Conexibacter woesei DSM 14684]
MIAATDPREALHRHFGFDDFRPGQAAAVGAALDGRDALVVMPTGAGKSLCYQLPALVRDDLTLVVSPLVSLMQDQVESLARIAPGSVALLNSQQSAAENRVALARAVSGDLRLLYVAPERFASPGFVAQIERARIGLFVVDEAHCVSQWGHDFRPDYFRLADAARYLRARAIMALTATATPRVADDIAARLGLAEPVRVTTGFDRPNLSFAVVPCRSKQDKHRRIAAVLHDLESRPAIVYAGTRNGCEELARSLGRTLELDVAVYHAGLPRDRRAAVQRAFMAGDTPIVVATNAFGMGVDKADVRTVCHETVPQSVEAYYQEAGRAGRDGRPARCLLFSESRDKGLHVFFIERTQVEDAAFGAVARRIHRQAGDNGRYELDLGVLADVAGCDRDQARAIVGHLARAGLVQPAPSPPDRTIGRLVGSWDRSALLACRESAGEAQRVRWRQYRSIWAFVEQRRCRRGALLRHFGDRARPLTARGVPCCDVCRPEIAPGPAARAGGSSARDSVRQAGSSRGTVGLDETILELVASAEPPVGRARAVEILRGSRSKAIDEHSYDGLPAYGTFAHLRGEEVMQRVDMLNARGALPRLRRSTRG